MRITVKLFASLGQYLPPGATRNQIDLEFRDDTTLGELIAQLKLPPELTHLVVVDGFYIPPEARAGEVLRAGQEVAIFPPVAGG